MPEAFSLEIALRRPDSVIFRSRLTIFYPSLSFYSGSLSVYRLFMYLVQSLWVQT
jgi:hypothetical protein